MLTPTSLASMELLVLMCCFFDSHSSPPILKEITLPVWLRMSRCTAKDASTQVANEVRESAPRCMVRSLVPRRYCSSRRSFLFSCLVGWLTRPLRKASASRDVGAYAGANVDEPKQCGRFPPYVWEDGGKTSSISRRLFVHGVGVLVEDKIET